MDDLLVGCDVESRCIRPLPRVCSSSGHSKPINLHPEIHFLVAFEDNGFPSAAATLGRTFVVPITKLPVPTFLAGTVSIWSATIKENSRVGRRGIRAQGLRGSNCPPVAVDVLHDDIEPITSGTKRQGLPIDGRILGGLWQQFSRHIDLNRILKCLCDLSANRSNRPKILTVPRSTPSLFWNVISRFFIESLSEPVLCRRSPVRNPLARQMASG